jgi:transcriptional regulator with XRE-family HTH domain
VSTEAKTANKQPRRPHFIPEWAQEKGVSQKDLALAIGADPSNVSRWFSGTCPSQDWQIRLAVFFNVEIDALFRHPDEEWLINFLRGRKKVDVERIKQTMEVAFPKKQADE